MAGGDKSKGKQVAKKSKEYHGDKPEFILTHFHIHLFGNIFTINLYRGRVLVFYFVNLDNLENLAICYTSLSDLLVDMGWTNFLVLKEPYYPNLIKVFYSNILRTPSKGLELYTSRSKVHYPWYSNDDVVGKICRRSDLSSEFCKSTLKSQALPLQLRILHSVLQHVNSPQSGHGDEVIRLDLAIIDYILECSMLNVGYIILKHMLSTSNIAK